jgi:hypothetical protein
MENTAPQKKQWFKPEIILISSGNVNSGTHHNAINEGTLQPGTSGGFPTFHTPNGVGRYPSNIYTFVS